MLKITFALSTLLICSLNVYAGQCPPGSALRHDVPNKEWSLDSAYTSQGWELTFQSSKLVNSYLKFIPPGMPVFVSLSEYDAWKARCVYYAPLDNPHDKAPLIVQSQQRFDTQNIFQPKFIYQPNTLTYVCQATAGDSTSCVWL